jgi:hypothetical protein
MEWQLIETAPTEKGLCFLVYIPKIRYPVKVARRADYHRKHVKDISQPIVGSDTSFVYPPTHWMPLPKPPTES